MSRRFGAVSSDGFIGVEGPLRAAGWDRVPGGASGTAATALGLASWLLFDGIKGVLQALRSVNRVALDSRWDQAQRRLTTATRLKQTDPDAAVVAAANVIAATLLWEGGGLGQTTLSYEDEVDFGLVQIKRSQEATVAQALEDTELRPVMEEVREATLAFEQALRRAPGQGKALAPAAALRAATRACAHNFARSYIIVEALIEATPSGAEADALRTLLQPLDALADRA